MSVRLIESPVPSLERSRSVNVEVKTSAPDGSVLGILLESGEGADLLGLDANSLAPAGFTGAAGQTLTVPTSDGLPVVLVGTGTGLDDDGLRDAAASFARATEAHGDLALTLPAFDSISPSAAARLAIVGVLLARYRYDPFKAEQTVTPVSSLTLVVEGRRAAATRRGVEKGKAMAEATQLARDLANTPPANLTATRMAEIATGLAKERGLGIEVFDKDQLIEMGCGGLLGVNAGSSEPPRMIKLTYAPAKPRGRLTLVGKGIMYDAGGIAIKPGDAIHATMKNDMSGAGAILAAMSQLRALGCKSAVTGYLMCTDNLPSSTAIAMGEVITIYGGKTVEVENTDAEGRLVMADALVLATEEPTDAIVDVATLTGAAMRALGTQIAGLIGNNRSVIDQVEAAAATTGESVWELPLEHRYRGQLNSDVADMKNLGGPNAGAITAALFLEEFIAGKPWAHIDIAGTAQNDRDTSWRPPGCTGFGARLLIELALNFTRPRA